MILIVSPAEDVHARCVAQELSRLGQRYEVVDSSRLTVDGRLTFAPGQGSGLTWTSVEGKPVALDGVRAVWHRRRFMPVLPVLPDQNDVKYLRREWEEMFTGVFASMDCTFVNSPVAQQAATKPLQLKWASRLGIRFPDTVITNDPEQARQFVDKHRGRVIHKALSPPRHRWIGTMKWQADDATRLNDLVLSPTIFQEMVTDCRELRVTVIGNDCFAAEFRPKDGVIDGRLASFTGYRKHVLPEAVCHQLLALTARLGLIFCTIDMKFTDDGEYVFLELNPQGQFLYVEILTGMPLCQSLAGLLTAIAAERSPDADGRLDRERIGRPSIERLFATASRAPERDQNHIHANARRPPGAPGAPSRTGRREGRLLPR